MYKWRIKCWGFRKYIKPSETEVIQHSAYSGKIAQLPIANGRQLGSKKLKDLVKQSNGILLHITQQKTAPPLSPLLSHLRPPEAIALVETALHAVLAYSHGCLDSDIWNSPKPDAEQDPTSQWWFGIMGVTEMLKDQRDSAPAFQKLNQYLDQFRNIMERQDPSLLQSLYLTLVRLSDIGDDIALSFVRFAFNMSAILLGMHHPLTTLFLSVHKMGISQAREAAFVIITSQLDIINKNTRPGSPYWGTAMLMVVRQLYGVGIMSIESASATSEFIVDTLRANFDPHEPYSEYTVALAQMCFASITVQRRNGLVIHAR